MKSKNFTTSLLLLLMGLSIGFTSCKKDTSTTPKPDLFSGIYQITGSQVSISIAFETYTDGTLLVFKAAPNSTLKTGSGTYTLTTANNTTIFQAQVTYIDEPGVIYLYKSFLLDGSDLSNGTFGISPSNTDGGIWAMTKQ